MLNVKQGQKYIHHSFNERDIFFMNVTFSCLVILISTFHPRFTGLRFVVKFDLVDERSCCWLKFIAKFSLKFLLLRDTDPRFYDFLGKDSFIFYLFLRKKEWEKACHIPPFLMQNSCFPYFFLSKINIEQFLFATKKRQRAWERV